MVLAPARQASRNPAVLPFAPTISSAIRAKVGNSGRMPGRVLPRRDSQTMAAVTRPPAMPFQMMSIRKPTSSRRESRLSVITCDVIEPIHGDVEEPTRQERYNKAKEAENAEVYCAHHRVGAGEIQAHAARHARKVRVFTQCDGDDGRKSGPPQWVRRELRKFSWRQLRRVGEEGVGAHQCG